MVAVTTPATIQANSGHLRLARAAAAAGMPRDQVLLFVNAGYTPFPRALEFHAAARQADEANGPTLIAAGGARGPGKSHMVLAQAAVDDCQRYPGLKVLFLRKIMKSAGESMEDLAARVLRYVPHTLTAGRIEIGESRILIGGYKDERDIDKYLGIEYDLIILEEATQLSEDKFRAVRGSLRSTKPGWRARAYLTTNADGIGLAWFKELFVLPWREGRQDRTRFFPANYRDNPLLPTEYVDYLLELGDTPLGRAWRDGDWDAFAGAAFPLWNYDEHVVEPFPIPESWVRWRALDWGSAAPLAGYWFAKNPDTGQIVVYRELYERGLSDRAAARKIADMSPPAEKITVTYADPSSFWTTKSRDFELYTSADEYAKEGVILTKANNDRIQGKRALDNNLAHLPNGEPGIVFFRTCYNLVRTLPNLPRDDLHPEDVDTKAEDHSYDAIRYGLTNAPSKKPKKPARKRSIFADVSNL